MGFVKSRLSFMMFLQYAVWGLWLPVLARYLQASVDDGGLGFSTGQVATILGVASACGALTAPFIGGQLADRYISAEKLLALLLLLGGIVKFFTAYQTSFTMWLVLSVVYSVLYQPTLALTNSLTFAHVNNPDKYFPLVRVWGAIGWIAASWVFSMVWLLTDMSPATLPPFFTGTEIADVTNRLVDALKFSGGLSVLYAGFCFLLPRTPPNRENVEALAFVKAFALLKKPSFAVLMAACLPISIIHQAYFVQTGPYFSEVLSMQDSYIGPAMTIGQFAEILVMVALGFILLRFGFRTTIAIGCAAYFLRFAIFGTVDLPVPLIVSSQALHGVSYACFFVSVYMYTDRLAPPDIRHSAQTVVSIILIGVGPILSSPFLTILGRIFLPEDGPNNYAGFWYTMAGIALITTVAFVTFFRDETTGGGDE